MTLLQILADFKDKGYWRTFKQVFVGFGVLLILLMIISANSLLTSLTVGSIGGLITALILVPLVYWYEEFNLPNISKNNLSSPIFKYFINNGFKINNSVLEGIYKNYYGIIYWTEGNPFGKENKLSYSIRIIFFFTEDLNPPAEFIKNYKLEQIIWHNNTVEAVINSGRRKLPDQQELITKADRLIQLMQILNLSPGFELSE